jgi:phospholipase C
MIVISPWSKGGYVSSELFDHTSLIRFIEQRFGRGNAAMTEPNITPWRRAVSGDLTSAFNFKSPNDAKVQLPSTIAYIPPDANRHPDYVPTPPTDQALPVQESGTRPARPVPYELHVHGAANFSAGTFDIHFGNTGKTAVYQVRSGNSALGPWTYTVGKGAEVSDTWQITGNDMSGYDLSVNGPNGFLRAFQGSVSGEDKANLHIHTSYDAQSNGITLHLANRGHAVSVRITDRYTGDVHEVHLKAGEPADRHWSLHKTFGWYDLVVEVESDSTFRYELAGHVETGEESRTDPAIATV